MDKDIQEIRRRAGLTEGTLDMMDAVYIAGKLQSMMDDLESLSNHVKRDQNWQRVHGEIEAVKKSLLVATQSAVDMEKYIHKGGE